MEAGGTGQGRIQQPSLSVKRQTTLPDTAIAVPSVGKSAQIDVETLDTPEPAAPPALDGLRLSSEETRLPSHTCEDELITPGI